MNKIFFRYLSLIIPAIALYINVNAQFEKSGLDQNLKEFICNEDKADFGVIDEGNTAIISRVSKDFNKRFKNVNRADWFKIEDGYTATFKTNEMQIKVYYDRAGRWNATIRTYDQDKLLPDIRKQVRSTYYDYNIYLVTEVTVGDKTAYLVRIEDKETCKTIRVMDGDMDVYDQFIKG